MHFIQSSIKLLPFKPNRTPLWLPFVKHSSLKRRIDGLKCEEWHQFVSIGCHIDVMFTHIRFDSIADPPENLRLRPKRVDVIEDDIPPEILCQSDALPPASYRWLSASSSDKFIGVIADTPLLSLNTSIQRDRAGTYTCIAANRHGERRIDLLINVLCKRLSPSPPSLV